MLLFCFQVHLEAVDLALILIDLMLHISDPLLELSLIALMSQHQGGLLIFSVLSSLLNFTLSAVECLSFLLKFGLEFEDLLVLISLHLIKLFLKTFTVLLLFFPLLGEIGAIAFGFSQCNFELFVEELLVLLELSDFLEVLLAVLVSTVLRLLEPLVGLQFHSSQVLAVGLFRIHVLVVEHLALVLERLLKAGLGVVKFLLLLLVLLLKEGELSLPESLLLVQGGPGFLKIRLAAFKFTLELLQVGSCTEGSLFLNLAEVSVVSSQ